MPYPHKIIACRALVPILEKLLGTNVPICTMDIALHLQPDRLRFALNQKIIELEQEGTTIVMGYGLCGRSLEGVVSRKSTLVLPKVDDCVGMLLGSRTRHRQVLARLPGSYFLEQHWLDTELNIFTQIHKGNDRIPEARRDALLQLALQHYENLILLTDNTPEQGTKQTESECVRLAEQHAMAFKRINKDLELIRRLLHGPWCNTEFILAPPGTPIPLF